MLLAKPVRSREADNVYEMLYIPTDFEPMKTSALVQWWIEKITEHKVISSSCSRAFKKSGVFTTHVLQHRGGSRIFPND